MPAIVDAYLDEIERLAQESAATAARPCRP
jgi:hypothetical protein